MKKLLLLSSFCFLMIYMPTKAQGIDFFHGTWSEALDLAKKQGKIVFVDAYASWCGPCKRMASDVFPQPKVGEFFNKHFVCMKLDMEKEEAAEFRVKYPVSSFPTYLFIQTDGKVVQKAVGMMQPDKFIDLGKTVVSKLDNSADFAKKYEAGDRSPDLVYNYIKALNKAGKSSLKIANEYLATQKDLTTPQNLQFLLEATTEADSRIFDMMTKNRAAIAALETEDIVKNRIENACLNTAKKAAQFKNESLLDEAKAKMKQHLPDRAEAFETMADMKFYALIGDTKKYIKACDSYAKKQLKNDGEKLHQLAQDMSYTFEGDQNIAKEAEKYAKKAAEINNSHTSYYLYADLAFKNGKRDDALKAAKKALELAKEKEKSTTLIEQLLQRIELAKS